MPSTPDKPQRSRRDMARSVGGISLLAIVALFAVLNLGSVHVNYILGSGSAPLIIVIVVSVLLGVALGYLGQRAKRRAR
jgi:uncharacterized integral membrane protein